MFTNRRVSGVRSALPILLALPLSVSACSEPQTAAQKTDQAHNDAVALLGDMTNVVDQANDISPATKGKARCLVVASIGKGAFLVGGSHGSGVVTCRTSSGWSGPAFISLTGMSVGLQAGGQSSDVLMLVTTDKAVQRLFQGSLKLGADASVAAGPAGAGTGAATDTSTSAEILTYARSKGAFAGVDVSGMGISYNMDRIAALYGSVPSVRAVLTGAVPAPATAQPFLGQVRSMFQGTGPVAGL
jgi:SH3 domain-containing YSC84-like protein 1